MAEYRDLGAQINELVGRINGTYGNLEYSPVHYINQSLSQVGTGCVMCCTEVYVCSSRASCVCMCVCVLGC